MRDVVEAFVQGGPLPGEEAEEAEINRRQSQLEAITRPVSEDEARALLRCFGKTGVMASRGRYCI